MEWLTENWDGILTALVCLHAAASAVAALTPTKWDDNLLVQIAQFLSVVQPRSARPMLPYRRPRKDDLK